MVQPRSPERRGGRGRVYLGRALLYLVLIVIGLNGLARILHHSTPPSTSAIAGKVAEELSFNGYPLQAAEGFAVRFTTDYLTYSPGHQQLREDEMRGYTLNNPQGLLDPDADWNGQGSQQVVNAFVSGAPRQIAPHTLSITVAAQTDAGQWLYVAVPVYGTGTETAPQLTLAGAPGFVSPPVRALMPNPPTQAEDTDFETAIAPRLQLFFPAWAASDSNAMTGTVKPGVHLVGLAGGLRFISLGNVYAAKVDGEPATRQITAQVTWGLLNGGQLTQTYTLTLVQVHVSGAATWYVQSIAGGALDTTGSSGRPAPAAAKSAPRTTTARAHR